jgi:hypothetical protein
MEMEMLLVVYNAWIDDEMLEALKQAGMKYYTRFTNLHGEGESSEPRLDTQVWPGTNSMLLVCVEPAGKETLLEAVRRMKNIHREEGVRAFVLPVTASV